MSFPAYLSPARARNQTFIACYGGVTGLGVSTVDGGLPAGKEFLAGISQDGAGGRLRGACP